MKKILPFLFLILFFNWTCKPDLKVPKPSSGDADFSKFIALGGQFMAGYQDGALYKDGQQYSIPYQLAKYMALSGGSSLFAQPFMSDNSGLGINPKQWESAYQTASKLGFQKDCKGISSLFPVKNNFSSGGSYAAPVSGPFQNLAVPFAKISVYNSTSLSTNIFYSRMGNSTMLIDAQFQLPTFFALWGGMEDIFDYASNGGNKIPVLPSYNFSLYLDSILTKLNTKGIIANIPDFTSFPFYTTIPWNALALTQHQADSLNTVSSGQYNFVAGNNGFVIADSHSPSGYRKMVSGEYVLLTAPLDSIKCSGMGAATMELPGRYVLDTSEVKIINTLVAGYNTVIAAKAQQYNLALADMNSYFKSVVTGIKWNGVDYNAQFVSGGFFSLDGYCPNQKGYALIANKFIEAINAKYHSTIPWVNCMECSGIKFP